MIRIEWANYDDLAYVANWLSDADRMELAATRDPDDYLRLAGDAYQSRYKLVALDHSVPIFAFGANPVGADIETLRIMPYKPHRALYVFDLSRVVESRRGAMRE